MCNLSEGIIEKTATKTWDKAWKQATEAADRQANMLMSNMIIAVMDNLSVDFDTAVDLMSLPADKLETYRGLVAELQK